MLLFYDVESFRYDWIVVIIDPEKRKDYIFVNDKDDFLKFYEEHKNYIWIGYNSRNYDAYMIKSIICNFNLYEVNDFIITKKKKGYLFSNLFNKIQLYNYDVMNMRISLKTLEGFMGNNIEETSVSFGIDRKLTSEEIEQTIKYCKYDVEQTMEVFTQRIDNFNTSMSLIKMFNLPISAISKTHAQLVATILGGRGQKFDDEFDLEIVPSLQLKKYDEVLHWYEYVFSRPHEYTEKLETVIAGVPTTFGFGGIHGSLERYSMTGHYLLIDVTAYYPSLQLQYKFGYRNMGKPENFELIHNENLRLKVIGDKKAREPFKIADNSISGQLKDKYSKLYDPKYNNAVCVNGQLLMLDLIEKLEGNCKMIFYNTDGILIKLHSLDDFNKIDDIVYEFECRTRMKFDFEHYKRVYVKDVNNYVIIAADGKYKTKGAYVKQLNDLDYDLPIVNTALVKYMVNNVPIEETINNCNELKEFQKIYKVSNSYLRAWHNGQYLNDKTFRVFASKNWVDSYIGKQKNLGGTIEKFAGSPEHCFIMNENINGMKVPGKLDKRFYIDLAYDRLYQFTLES